MVWSCSGYRQHLLHLATPVTRPDGVFRQGHCLRLPTTPKDTTRIAQSTSTQQLGTSHKTCLRGFGGNGSIAWTSAVSHVGRTSSAVKVTMKLQTFLFQMAVTSCIYVQNLWKYGLAKSSDNLYTPCIIRWRLIFVGSWYGNCFILRFWFWILRFLQNFWKNCASLFWDVVENIFRS